MLARDAEDDCIRDLSIPDDPHVFDVRVVDEPVVVSEKDMIRPPRESREIGCGITDAVLLLIFTYALYWQRKK